MPGTPRRSRRGCGWAACWWNAGNRKRRWGCWMRSRWSAPGPRRPTSARRRGWRWPASPCRKPIPPPRSTPSTAAKRRRRTPASSWSTGSPARVCSPGWGTRNRRSACSRRRSPRHRAIPARAGRNWRSPTSCSIGRASARRSIPTRPISIRSPNPVGRRAPASGAAGRCGISAGSRRPRRRSSRPPRCRPTGPCAKRRWSRPRTPISRTASTNWPRRPTAARWRPSRRAR